MRSIHEKRIITRIPISSTRYSSFIILVQLETSSCFLQQIENTTPIKTLKSNFSISKDSEKPKLLHHEIQERKYDVYHGNQQQQQQEEHISRKFIRPCPPTVEISVHYPGDVVEVFHNLSWKMAIVSKSFNLDLFQVRLVGSFIEIKARKSELRVRQSWQNNKWVVIGNRNKKQRYTHDSVSDTSSVGSCSVDDKFQNIKEGDIESDDGESVCEGGYFGDNKKELGLGAEIHRLELKAYRRTIEALHASGPLSWEKESMAQKLEACTPGCIAGLIFKFWPFKDHYAAYAGKNSI
ncbi:unnamed protein product [Lactuca virosa]|uniref:Agenet domain-containing protein n=1 Tax=Lactuca virosa TaxID=75947 RepID=A0AAU9MLT9_9ASTR|nr:unnamed protein product [Lactuca virosa]